MLTLYFKSTCPYSQSVIGEAEALGIQLNLKDISTDKTLVQELIDKGGKEQTPYISDQEKNISMYESRDIIKYLQNNYSKLNQKESFGGLRIHKSEEMCDTCQ